MPEIQTNKLIWKYSPPSPGAIEWRDEWILYVGDKDIAKFTKFESEFMRRHNIITPVFCYRAGYKDFLPWLEIGKSSYCDLLFALSNQGVEFFELEDIYQNA